MHTTHVRSAGTNFLLRIVLIYPAILFSLITPVYHRVVCFSIQGNATHCKNNVAQHGLPRSGEREHRIVYRGQRFRRLLVWVYLFSYGRMLV